MPDFPITDAHVHLYDPAKLSYPWLANVPKINRAYGLADFDAARGPVDVEAIVFAEVAVAPGQHLAEAAWVQSLADTDPRIQGIIAHAPLEKGPAAVEADLEQLKQNRCLKGIRRLIETEMDPRFCLEPAFLDALRLLPKHNLTFDICVKHWYLAFALELARRCPDVTFILDHIGKPGIKHAMQEPWKTQIKELASLPNTHCKVSGVITEADHSTLDQGAGQTLPPPRPRLLRHRPNLLRQRLDRLRAHPPLPNLGPNPRRNPRRHHPRRATEILANQRAESISAGRVEEREDSGRQRLPAPTRALVIRRRRADGLQTSRSAGWDGNALRRGPPHQRHLLLHQFCRHRAHPAPAKKQLSALISHFLRCFVPNPAVARCTNSQSL